MSKAQIAHEVRAGFVRMLTLSQGVGKEGAVSLCIEILCPAFASSNLFVSVCAYQSSNKQWYCQIGQKFNCIYLYIRAHKFAGLLIFNINAYVQFFLKASLLISSPLYTCFCLFGQFKHSPHHLQIWISICSVFSSNIHITCLDNICFYDNRLSQNIPFLP